MEICLIIGFVLGLCGGSVVLVGGWGDVLAPLEGLLLFVLSAVCLGALATIRAIEKQR